MADKLTNSNNQIENGLRADVMRKSMENKNLLKDKGSIYVGTGEKETIVVQGENVSVAKTDALPVGETNQVLKVKNGTVEYGFVDADSFGTDQVSLPNTVKMTENNLTGTISADKLVLLKDGESSITGVSTAAGIQTTVTLIQNEGEGINVKVESKDTTQWHSFSFDSNGSASKVSDIPTGKIEGYLKLWYAGSDSNTSVFPVGCFEINGTEEEVTLHKYIMDSVESTTSNNVIYLTTSYYYLYLDYYSTGHLFTATLKQKKICQEYHMSTTQGITECEPKITITEQVPPLGTWEFYWHQIK